MYRKVMNNGPATCVHIPASWCASYRRPFLITRAATRRTVAHNTTRGLNPRKYMLLLQFNRCSKVSVHPSQLFPMYGCVDKSSHRHISIISTTICRRHPPFYHQIIAQTPENEPYRAQMMPDVIGAPGKYFLLCFWFVSTNQGYSFMLRETTGNETEKGCCKPLLTGWMTEDQEIMGKVYGNKRGREVHLQASPHTVVHEGEAWG
jgi:hypothetical protein